VDGGQIGELRCVRASFGFPPFPDAGNIRYQPELGGGALLDVGAYPIKISQILLGENLSVTAAKTFVDSEKCVDIWGGGFLSQNDGPLFSEIAFGFDHHYQCGIELWGSRGKLTANRLFTAPPGGARGCEGPGG
jgi:predicted dehydrogenase